MRVGDPLSEHDKAGVWGEGVEDWGVKVSDYEVVDFLALAQECSGVFYDTFVFVAEGVCYVLPGVSGGVAPSLAQCHRPVWVQQVGKEPSGGVAGEESQHGTTPKIVLPKGVRVIHKNTPTRLCIKNIWRSVNHHPDLPGQIIPGPHIVVADHEMDLDPRVCQGGQAAQYADKSGRNYMRPFVPKIKNIAHQKKLLAVGGYLV